MRNKNNFYQRGHTFSISNFQAFKRSAFQSLTFPPGQNSEHPFNIWTFERLEVWKFEGLKIGEFWSLTVWTFQSKVLLAFRFVLPIAYCPLPCLSPKVKLMFAPLFVLPTKLKLPASASCFLQNPAAGFCRKHRAEAGSFNFVGSTNTTLAITIGHSSTLSEAQTRH